MRSVVLAVCAAVLLVFSTPAYVHHSGAMFDRNKEITITGTVTEFNWTNPHSSFKVEVPEEDGTKRIWAIEMNGPNNIVRLGWKRSTIKPGDKVSVRINPLRNGQPGGWYLGITLPDGTVLGGEPPQR
jgi:hypothetical protein